ncbi:MAG: methylmalonyl-CoA mutase [Euryarchaeota archaeon]|mgnify:FL=1|nr:methylmalonyl-CoA mutase [Euryarchaeota archaeon]|tara:strand:- start:7775 stop:8224 length:450 start_codon:yes stop_codon:yes gene_type:complete
MDERLRIIIAKPGLDGHDRGAKVVARALRDAGHEVIYTGLRRTPEEIVRTVIDEDADFLGLSSLSGAHNFLIPKIVELLVASDCNDVIVFAGGIIPEKDRGNLFSKGVRAIFGPGTSSTQMSDFIGSAVKRRDESLPVGCGEDSDWHWD